MLINSVHISSTYRGAVHIHNPNTAMMMWSSNARFVASSFLLLSAAAALVQGGQAAGQCMGGSFACADLQVQDDNACGYMYPFCEKNYNKESGLDSDCKSTAYQPSAVDDQVHCTQLGEAQCNMAPQQDGWNGCTWVKTNDALLAANVALNSIAMALLLVAVGLLVKVSRAIQVSSGSDSGQEGVEVTGAVSEPLLEGGSNAQNERM